MSMVLSICVRMCFYVAITFCCYFHNWESMKRYALPIDARCPCNWWNHIICINLIICIIHLLYTTIYNLPIEVLVCIQIQFQSVRNIGILSLFERFIEIDEQVIKHLSTFKCILCKYIFTCIINCSVHFIPIHIDQIRQWFSVHMRIMAWKCIMFVHLNCFKIALY